MSSKSHKLKVERALIFLSSPFLFSLSCFFKNLYRPSAPITNMCTKLLSSHHLLYKPFTQKHVFFCTCFFLYFYPFLSMFSYLTLFLFFFAFSLSLCIFYLSIFLDSHFFLFPQPFFSDHFFYLCLNFLIIPLSFLFVPISFHPSSSLSMS